MLTLHHLGHSQSERIVWLCEELGIPYELKKYQRDAATRLSPPELLALTPMGTAPVITDGEWVLGESGAIMDYLLARHDTGSLRPRPADANFAAYLFWYHFANATLQPAMGRSMTLRRLDLPADNAVAAATRGRLVRAMDAVEARLAASPYLAGQALTAADIMIVFTLTTMRLFMPLDLAPWPGVRSYLQRIGQREAYQRAMRKGDPDLVPMLD
jgi:glutathione S-transferase